MMLSVLCCSSCMQTPNKTTHTTTHNNTQQQPNTKHTKQQLAEVYATKGDHTFAVFLLLRKEGWEMREGKKVLYRRWIHLSLCKDVPQVAKDIIYGQAA